MMDSDKANCTPPEATAAVPEENTVYGNGCIQDEPKIDGELIKQIYSRVYLNLQRVQDMFHDQFQQRLEAIVEVKLGEMALSSTMMSISMQERSSMYPTENPIFSSSLTC